MLVLVLVACSLGVVIMGLVVGIVMDIRRKITDLEKRLISLQKEVTEVNEWNEFWSKLTQDLLEMTQEDLEIMLEIMKRVVLGIRMEEEE